MSQDNTHKEDILKCSTYKKLLAFYCMVYTKPNFNKISNNTKARFTSSNCQTNNQKSPNTQKMEILGHPINSMEKNTEKSIKSVFL